jgi:hypothetical protein
MFTRELTRGQKITKLRIAILSVVSAIVAIFVIMFANAPVAAPSPAPKSTAPAAAINACDLFTHADAKNIFGGLALVADTADSQGQISRAGDVASSTCIYADGKAVIVRVIARVGLTATSTDTLRQAFMAAHASGQPVANLGDSAFWSPADANLSIFSGNAWLTVTRGGVAITDRNLNDTLPAAKIVVSHLSSSR